MCLAVMLGAAGCEEDSAETPSGDQLFVYEHAGAYGYMDIDGNVRIPARFARAWLFERGRALVRTADRLAIIDVTGRIVKQLSFQLTEGFEDGRAVVYTDMAITRYRAGVIDTDGELLLEARFRRIVLGDRDAPIFTYDGQLWSLRTLQGELVHQQTFLDVRPFREGLAPVCVEGEDGLACWGYIDVNGSWAIRPQFIYAEPFADGVALVGRREGTTKLVASHLFIDRTGQRICDQEFSRARSFREELAAVCRLWEDSPDDGIGKWGYVDRNCNVVIAYQFARGEDFSEGLAGAAVETGEEGDKTWGFVDRNGRWVIEPAFQSVGEFCGGAAWVEDARGSGYIDRSGKWLWRDDEAE